MQAHPGRGEWDEAAFSLGLHWEVIFGGERVVPWQNCPSGFELAACRLWGGGWAWLNRIVSSDPFGWCDPLRWYLHAVWSFGWYDSIPRASTLSDQGRWRTAEAEEDDERHRVRAEWKGELMQEGKQPSSREGPVSLNAHMTTPCSRQQELIQHTEINLPA